MKRERHSFIPELQYAPSKPVCKKCGFCKKNFRHRKIGIALIMQIMFGDGTNLKPSKRRRKTCECCHHKKKQFWRQNICKQCLHKKKLSLNQKICEGCSKKKKLTNHHLKDLQGNKTGEIQRLCRDCHDIAEDKYVQLGIVKPTPKGTMIVKNPLKKLICVS